MSLKEWKKDTPTQVCSCEYYQIFKNTYFKEHLRTAVSSVGWKESYVVAIGPLETGELENRGPRFLLTSIFDELKK